ncbi:hypothetical protein GCM10008995_24500 [Halobellus salinus]|uniref:Uncharacterized protein n=1 Tax=Halobellus salinus TaxID=931585 RepID=A0A830EDH0_9EURY|nr:hypothetical protein [Halobellus salinus]GGJ13720.1 hypothetical protein GCM10008995_24500 [Halobellus salinus]SMP30911.1 hypothetical protein SAMN06265347_11721 [Halobellus salinus]
MTDAADTLDAENGSKPTEDVVAGVIDDIDAAHDDYDRGYTDADATLAVVMSHVDRLREVRE